MTNVKHAQQRFVPGASRGPRRAATLLAQMADLERGERIRGLREQRHLTQPVVADRVGVTLRAYQEWEAGGGIQWENAKRLAKVLGSSPDYLMSGAPLATPDLSNGETQLDRIEAALTTLTEQLEAFRLNNAAAGAEVLQQLDAMQQQLEAALRPPRRSSKAA